MTTEKAIRILAGCMVLLSLALAVFLDLRWLFLTGFVGLNLIQSGFTGFCPPEFLFRRMGLKGGACSAGTGASSTAPSSE